MTNEFSPPNFPQVQSNVSIFLGGSIEMGTAIDWQKAFQEKFKEKVYERFTIYHTHKNEVTVDTNFSDNFYAKYQFLNPRRPDWDPSWKQTINDSRFFQQVMWELEYLQRATYRVFHFAGDTISPVTMLEFGTFHKYVNTYVHWDDNYKRAGNLEVFCYKFNIKRYPTLDAIIDKIITA